jgi:hypothetical protein
VRAMPGTPDEDGKHDRMLPFLGDALVLGAPPRILRG